MNTKFNFEEYYAPDCWTFHLWIEV